MTVETLLKPITPLDNRPKTLMLTVAEKKIEISAPTNCVCRCATNILLDYSGRSPASNSFYCPAAGRSA